MMDTNKYWLSYDLGFGGDYEGLYNWLDKIGAIECGDNLAFINAEYKGDPLKAIRKEIGQFVKLDEKSRFYIIYKDTHSGEVKGKFLIGRRKRAPWWGYSPAGIENQED